MVFTLELIVFNVAIENKNFFTDNWGNILLILQSQILLVSLTLSVIFMEHSYMILVSSAYMSISSFRINLWIQNYILQLNHSVAARFLVYRKAYIKSFLNLIKGGKYYGKIFVAFLAVQFPFSCVFILNLFKLKDSISYSITMVLEQLLVTVAVHYWFAKNNSRLSIKKMMSQSIHNWVPLGTRSHIKMNLFIQTFHTRNPYGFTYGTLGLISMFTFFKVISVNLK